MLTTTNYCSIIDLSGLILYPCDNIVIFIKDGSYVIETADCGFGINIIDGYIESIEVELEIEGLGTITVNGNSILENRAIEELIRKELDYESL
jgi:hypothetical protein